MEDNEADKKKFHYLVASLIKGEDNFKRVMSKLIETVLRKCKKEKKKKNGGYRKTPKQKIKTLT